MVKDFHVILELSSPVLKSAVSKSYSPVNVGCVVLENINYVIVLSYVLIYTISL